MLNVKIENIKDLQSATKALQRFLLDLGVNRDSVFDCKLVLNELVSNVLKHAKATATVQGRIIEGFGELKIYSETAFIPPEISTCSDVYSENGRGLFLVDSVCATRENTADGAILVTIKI